MPKTKISEYSSNPALNTDIDGINIAEGMAPSDVNNAIRELMAQLKDFQTGASADAFTFAGGVLISGSPNTVSGSLVVSGNINSSGTTNTFSGGNILSGTNTISGSAIISGNINSSGSNTFSGAQVISGNINSSGTNTFSSSQIISGNINSSGTNTFSGSNVISVGAGTSASPSIYFASDTNTGIFSPAADTIAFTEGGAEAMRIDSSGNVGIGTSSPQTRLQITTASDGSQAIFSGNQSTNEQTLLFRNAYYTNNGTAGVAAIGWIDSGSSGGNLTFKTGTNGGGTTNIPTERMRIDSSGNVGIGTSSPSTKLTVSSATNAGLAVTDGTVNTIVYNSTGGVGSIGTTTNHAVDFYTNNSAKMRIDSSGNVGIGTTSVNNTDANRKVLEINGTNTSLLNLSNGGTRKGYVYNDGTNIWVGAEAASGVLRFDTVGTERARIPSGGGLLVGCTATPSATVKGVEITGDIASTFSKSATLSTGDIRHWAFYNPNGLVGGISTNGSGTAFSTTSDYRLKENVAPMTGALDTVAQLKPCTYTWKSDGSAGQGFIAHELQEVCPEAVCGIKDAVDGNGKPVYQSVDTSFLVATLAAAIQELKAELDEAKARIAALES